MLKFASKVSPALGWLSFWNELRAEIEMHPAGFEPATYGLEIRCSIQLS